MEYLKISIEASKENLVEKNKITIKNFYSNLFCKKYKISKTIRIAKNMPILP